MFVLGLLVVSSAALAQGASPAVLVITASDDATSGAAIRIDGDPSGNVPLRKTLTPGRHLLQVGKRGFATFSKWVDLVGGEVTTIPVALQPQAVKTGSLLITADVTGMPVFIDGQRRGGTPLVVDGLTEGEHVVEIRSPGEGYHPFSKVVLIKANERATVEATIRVAPDLGSLRVIANVPGAIISLDGVDIGVAPAAKGALPPGEHTVMARATGYENVTQAVTVIAGRERVVSMRFTTASTDVARVWVRANVPEATVTIDGEDYGNPPITIEPAEFGTHAVVVRAPGYREVRRTCSVGPSRNCDVYAELNPLGVPVRIEANVAGAQLFIDGEARGPVPWEGDLPAGTHQLEVRADGYENHVEQINLQKSPRVRLIQVIMSTAVVAVDQKRRDKEAERDDPLRNTVTHAGAPLPVGVATLDFSTGWPWLASLGMRAGLTKLLPPSGASPTSPSARRPVGAYRATSPWAETSRSAAAWGHLNAIVSSARAIQPTTSSSPSMRSSACTFPLAGLSRSGSPATSTATVGISRVATAVPLRQAPVRTWCAPGSAAHLKSL
ncbi:MAG: PEGA domain-containing protein [Deltaproteobacteria bacterium]|nr:PEGA domain-containing protein [Deltaproteobacteria bacterium]